MTERQMSQPQNNQYNPQPNDCTDAISQVVAMAQNGANLEAEFKNQLRRNPDKAQAFAQFIQQYKGRQPWDVAYELMAQRGINPAQFGLPPRR